MRVGMSWKAKSIKLLDPRYFGLGLVEILIALLLISISLLAIFKASRISLYNTRQAYYKSIANTELNNIAAQLQAGKTVTSSEILPQGVSELKYNNKQYQITIHWQTPEVGGAASKIQQETLSRRVNV